MEEAMAQQWNAKLLREQFRLRKSLSRMVLFLVLAAVAAVFFITTFFCLYYVKMKTGTFPSGTFFTAYFLVSAALFIVVVAVTVRIVKKRIIDPVNIIAETAEKYAEDRADGKLDDFYFRRLNLKTGDEMEKLFHVLSGMEQDISDAEQKLLRAAVEKQRINTELSVANDIQRNMLPNIFPPFPERNEFEIYASMDPAKEIGGDYFDFIMVDDSHLALVMADVSGKGIPAALFMMSTMIIIENYASMGFSPKKVLEMSNESICSMELVDMFVTVWFGILDLKTGIVTAANAGHEYPALKTAEGEYRLMKKKHGFVVGGMEGIKYREYTFTMEPGDSLFLYTDGVPEASDVRNEQYGTERMLSALNRGKDLSPKELLAFVRNDIDAFVQNAPQFDDLTMMCVKYRGSLSFPE